MSLCQLAEGVVTQPITFKSTSLLPGGSSVSFTEDSTATLGGSFSCVPSMMLSVLTGLAAMPRGTSHQRLLQQQLTRHS